MNHHKNELNIALRVAHESELETFKRDLQSAFKVSAEKEFGHALDEPIPCDEDIEHAMLARGSIVYWIVTDKEIVGGAVVVIDEATQHNSLSFFFISTNKQSRGVGLLAWKAIEKAHPNTKVWETATPYFEKRNIHFYVNKCGFKIVAFYTKFNPDPHQHTSASLDNEEEDEMFRFEKVME